MTAKEIQKIIKNQNNKIIEAVRSEVDEMSMLLSPVYQGAELLCAKFVSDFAIDGYRFIRSKYISEIITGEKMKLFRFLTAYILRKILLIIPLAPIHPIPSVSFLKSLQNQERL